MKGTQTEGTRVRQVKTETELFHKGALNKLSMAT